MLDSLKSAIFEEDVREFALIRRRGQSSDPSKVKSYSRRKSPHEVELEEDLPVGRYVLQEIRESGDFGDQLWSEVLFGDESEIEEAIRRAEVAEKKAERAEQTVSGGVATVDDFENPRERLKYQIQQTIVEDERLLEEYGDQLVGWALSNGLSPDTDVEISSLPALVGYRSFEEPERAGELAEQVMSGLSEGLAGDSDETLNSIKNAFSSTTDEGGEEIEASEDAGGSGSSLSGAPSTTGPSAVGEASSAFEPAADGDDAGEVAVGGEADGADGGKAGEGRSA